MGTLSKLRRMVLRKNVSVLTEDEHVVRWRLCRPDVFSIRNTSVVGDMEPIVHEIKVSRADLLGDLKLKHKRDSYLDVGGQCWYVLGCDSKGRPIGQETDVPDECGVLIAEADKLHVARNATKRPAMELPFAIWMTLAKATPFVSGEMAADCDLGGSKSLASWSISNSKKRCDAGEQGRAEYLEVSKTQQGRHFAK